jgi:hypothetical protein
VTRGSRPAALALPLLAATAAAVFGFDLLAGRALVGFTNFDLFAEFLPRHAYYGAALRRAEIPLWDPHQIAGLPFLATLQGGVLYPPNLLYALLPTGFAMGLLGALHLALAGIGMYALCREFRGSPAAAGLGAVAFMLSGSALFATYHTNAINALPWLPLALACAARLARTGDLRLALALGAALALQFLAGRDYTFVLTAQLVAVFGLCQAAWMLREGRGSRPVMRYLAALALAAVVAAGLAAPQILPTLALSERSTRLLAGPETASLELFGPLSPAYFFANLVNPVRGPIRREFSGWIPLLCFAAGFRLWGRDRAAVFASALALVSLVLCFGSQTPLYALYRALPLASVFRLPDRFVLLLSLAIALGAARGFDRLLPPSPPAPLRALAPALAAAGVLGAALAVALGSGWLARGLAAADHPWGWFWMYGLSAAHFEGVPRAWIHLLGALGLLALAAWRAGRSGGGLARAAVVALAATELAWAFQSPFLHPARDAEPALAGRDCYAQAAGLLGEHGRHLSLSLPDSFALKDKDGELYGGFSATHYDPLVTRRHALYFAALQQGGAPRYATPWNEASPFMGFLTAVPTPERQPLLDLLGVRALLLDARPSGQPPAVRALLAGFQPAARCQVATERGSAPVEIYANPHALPRAFLVGGVAAASGPEDALRQLVAPGFDPRRSVVVETDAKLDPMPPADAPGDARITAYQSERVVVEAQAASPAWLVLTDSFDPDWSATIDREPARVLPADGMFRAVPLPPGRWEVEFRYRPRALRWGSVASALTLLLVLGLAWRWRASGQRGSIESSSIS